MYFSPLAMRELVSGLGPRTKAAVSALLPGPVTLVVANPRAALPARLPRGPRAARRPPDRRPAGRDDVPGLPDLGQPQRRAGAGSLRGRPRTRSSTAPTWRSTAASCPGCPRPSSTSPRSTRTASWRILRDGALSPGRPRQRARLGRSRLRRSRSGSAAGLAAVGQADEALGAVVVLVRLEEVFLRVDDHPVGEAAAQPGDVDPLLVVGRGVDVRPADRGAELDPVAGGVLVAAGVDAAGRRAAAGAGAARGRAGSS